MQASIAWDNAFFAANILNNTSGIGGGEDEGIGKTATIRKSGEKAGAERVASASGVFDRNIFVKSDTINFIAVGSDSALVAVGNDDIWHVILEAIDEFFESGAGDEFFGFVFINEQDVYFWE